MVHSNYNTNHNIISNSIEEFDTYKNDYLNVNLPAPREKDHTHFFDKDYDEELDIVICNKEQVNNIDEDLESPLKENHIIIFDDDLDDVYYNGINYSDSYEPLSASREKDNDKFFNNNNNFSLFNILRINIKNI
jgi:hypothetical protein